MRTKWDSFLENTLAPLAIVVIIFTFAYIAGHVRISYSNKKIESYETIRM